MARLEAATEAGSGSEASRGLSPRGLSMTSAGGETPEIALLKLLNWTASGTSNRGFCPTQTSAVCSGTFFKDACSEIQFLICWRASSVRSTNCIPASFWDSLFQTILQDASKGSENSGNLTCTSLKGRLVSIMAADP